MPARTDDRDPRPHHRGRAAALLRAGDDGGERAGAGRRGRRHRARPLLPLRLEGRPDPRGVRAPAATVASTGHRDEPVPPPRSIEPDRRAGGARVRRARRRRASSSGSCSARTSSATPTRSQVGAELAAAWRERWQDVLAGLRRSRARRRRRRGRRRDRDVPVGTLRRVPQPARPDGRPAASRRSRALDRRPRSARDATSDGATRRTTARSRRSTPSRLSRKRIILTTAAAIVGDVPRRLDGTIVSTAMPTIVGDLHGIDHYAWVFSGFLLAEIATIPLWGRLADMFGRKRIFLIGMAIFLLGSALCGMAQSMTELVLFRAIQGRRRRLPAAGRADDHRRPLHARAAGARSPRSTPACSGSRRVHRPAHRRVPHRPAVVALGVLREPPDRHRRDGPRRGRDGRAAPAPTPPPASTGAESSRCSAGPACSSSRSRPAGATSRGARSPIVGALVVERDPASWPSSSSSGA